MMLLLEVEEVSKLLIGSISIGQSLSMYPRSMSSSLSFTGLLLGHCIFMVFGDNNIVMRFDLLIQDVLDFYILQALKVVRLSCLEVRLVKMDSNCWLI